jgi:2-succinyl-5-enolpyruvyl-6-hydroxy-3-cyclohexene-1-carboxylate synthase
MAFFYDRNAFWNNYPVPNLRIVLLNNHGGVIFTLIDGPAQLPEADEFFVTRQKLNAQKLCEEFRFDYIHVSTREKLNNQLNAFFKASQKTKVLELDTRVELSKTVFGNFKKKIKKSYET